MAIPSDYEERVYAGVLGKLIGVYLGPPFEGWDYARIMAELGPANDYVHARFGVPLVVTDDDVAGTFTFPRALEDHGFDPLLSAARIGETWLNYIVEGRTTLWWGGFGTSTEETAWRRLRRRAGQRLDRTQRADDRGTDRRADRHRWVGDDVPGRSGPRGPARARGRPGQP